MQPTWREKDPSSQGPHSDSACGKQHVGVVCLVPACSGTRVYQRKGREDSTCSARPVNQSNSAELVEKCPPTTRHKVRNAVTTAEVKSPKLQTCDKQQPRGDWSHEPRDLDGRAGPRCTIARTT